MHIFAYLDAGTGSMFIQAVIGFFLAASVVLRSFFAKAIHKVKSVFKKTAKEDA